MSKLTSRMKEMIEKGLMFIATADKEGMPNIACKGSAKVLDDETIMYIEGFGKKTLKNLKKNLKIVAAIADREKIDGYQFKGTAKIVRCGSLYNKAVEDFLQRGRPKPKCVVKIKIEEIYSLKPEQAGERVG